MINYGGSETNKSTDGKWRIKVTLRQKSRLRNESEFTGFPKGQNRKNLLHKQETQIYVDAARVRYLGNKDMQRDRQCTNNTSGAFE
jgi:hypothetical protein